MSECAPVVVVLYWDQRFLAGNNERSAWWASRQFRRNVGNFAN
jgi:hypothetical protein